MKLIRATSEVPSATPLSIAGLEAIRRGLRIAPALAILAALGAPAQAKVGPYPVAAAESPPRASTPRATYHGGPLLAHVRIVTVYWSRNVRNQDRLDSFYASMAGGPYLDSLEEYLNPLESGGSRQWLAAVTDPDPPAAGRLTEADVEQELDRLLDANWIPPPDDQTIYMVHFPPGVAIIDGDGQASCERWCGEHDAYARRGQNVYFAVLPDLGPSCRACALVDDEFDSETIVASEELAEAATNPAGNLDVVRPGRVIRASILSWLDDASNREIGDVCAPRWGRVLGFAVRSVWSNRRKRCVAGPL